MALTGVAADSLVLCGTGLIPIEKYIGKPEWIYPDDASVLSDGTTYKKSIRFAPQAEKSHEILYTFTTELGTTLTAAQSQLIGCTYGFKEANTVKKGDRISMFTGPMPSATIVHDFSRFSYLYGLSYMQPSSLPSSETKSEHATALSVHVDIYKDAIDTLKFIANRSTPYWTNVFYEDDPDIDGNILIWLSFRPPGDEYASNAVYDGILRIMQGTSADPYKDSDRTTVYSRRTVFTAIPDYLINAPDITHSAGREEFLRGLFRRSYKQGPLTPNELAGETFISSDKTNVDRLVFTLLLCGVPSAVTEDMTSNESTYTLNVLKRESLRTDETSNKNIWSVPVVSVKEEKLEDTENPYEFYRLGLEENCIFFANLVLVQT